MEHLYEKVLESAEYIKTHTKKRPKIAVVLGSGLGKLTADFTDTEELSYKDIPNFQYIHGGRTQRCIVGWQAGGHGSLRHGRPLPFL